MWTVVKNHPVYIHIHESRLGYIFFLNSINMVISNNIETLKITICENDLDLCGIDFIIRIGYIKVSYHLL